MTSPAQELRAAAKTLRCDHSFSVLPPAGSIASPGDCSECGVAWGDHEVAPEILAEPLAALLEDQAGVFEVFRDKHGSDVAERVVLRGLDVARALSGGASS